MAAFPQSRTCKSAMRCTEEACNTSAHPCLELCMPFREQAKSLLDRVQPRML